MENKYKKLVDDLNRFNEAIQNFGKTLQLVNEHNEKYKYLYANEDTVSTKQIM